MENRLSYYNWFQNIISVFIDMFFYVVPLVTLYVFTVSFEGYIRLIVYAILLLVYCLVIYFFREKIKPLMSYVLEKISCLDIRTMFLIITLSAVLLKIVFTIFFNYDATVSGDIEIYNDIAEGIIKTGNIHSEEISHLYGVALQFVLFKLIGIPLHVGLFIAIYIGITANFFSFCKIVGKEKSFLLTMLYLLMPSTSFFTFSPTHEVFVFMYVSVFLYFYNKMLAESDTKKTAVYLFVTVASTVLTCFVNPGGYILYVIMALTALFSNIRIDKKILVISALLVSILCSSLLSSFLEINEYKTSMNTYTILIHGVNPNSLGEQEDGYPLKQMRMYIYENTLDFSEDGFLDAAKHVLINHYLFLLKNPLVLFRLIIHKIYILWSGVHYPIELANHYGAVSGLLYLFFLGINTLIYLFMVTVGLVYYRKKQDSVFVSNYKLELLGVAAMTLLCIVVNKYSVYATMFIYLTSFYRADFKNEKQN